MSLPEVLAPAGDRASMEAAAAAGADAVYFGLQGFNARARATNFDEAGLADTMRFLHERGVKGYVTLNTLVFDDELPNVENAIRACAGAGVDAVIVQDLAVAKLVREIAPSLPVHASTQMTVTDASSAKLAADLGATRVILARELSIPEIARIREESGVEVEVFVHGALCISYSGQCLTSEAIGGRSANRGACAQACRLPYELVVDGQLVPTDDRAFLLSPEDLEASALIPSLAASGVASIKIEGRLKGPEYVASTTKLYRKAVDEGVSDPVLRREALQTFTRGSNHGFLDGVDHQRLVEGRACDHRGLLAGSLTGFARGRLSVRLAADLARGDGILIEGGLGGEGEVGGRVWSIDRAGKDVVSAGPGDRVDVWLGPDVRVGDLPTGRRIWKTSAPDNDKKILDSLGRRAVAIDVVISGSIGSPFVLTARATDGRSATVTGDASIEAARSTPIDDAVLRDKLGRLGDSTFELRALSSELPPGVIVPLSSLNRARRALVVALDSQASRSHATTSAHYTDLLGSTAAPARTPAPAGLFVLCRTLEQARAAHEAGASGVYLDFLELTGTGEALRALRAEGAFVGVAPPRIRKPGEEKIDRFVSSLEPDAVLVRGLGALRELVSTKPRLAIGDFSLNVTNRITAAEVLSRGLDAFTPSFDLDAAQLTSMMKTPFGAWAEIVVHHPMALFHMEHCAIASLLSDGKDYRTCGRPCDSHRVSLRDRAGMEHPVEADVGCRNTVFHAKPQSALQMLPELVRSGVSRFRIELVRESADDVRRLVGAYRRAIESPAAAPSIWKELRTEGGYGIVRGSLRVVS